MVDVKDEKFESTGMESVGLECWGIYNLKTDKWLVLDTVLYAVYSRALAEQQLLCLASLYLHGEDYIVKKF